MRDIEREDGDSFHDARIKQALKGLASIQALSEEKHREEPTAIDLFQRGLNEELQKIHQNTTISQVPEPTFAERNRIITRRQSRRTVTTLMQRANHPTRRRR